MYSNKKNFVWITFLGLSCSSVSQLENRDTLVRGSRGHADHVRALQKLRDGREQFERHLFYQQSGLDAGGVHGQLVQVHVVLGTSKIRAVRGEPRCEQYCSLPWCLLLPVIYDGKNKKEMEQASVTTFYADRSIFITGGTGFLGKVLIEKLLRSCPNVREIFLLMRPKKGLSIDQRLKKMIESPLFDKVRELYPSNFEKLIPVLGDTSEEGLGLPKIERQVLIDRVSVVFHVAANVRFEEDLKKDILSNTRSTREICILAGSMKNLVSFVHVSTAYTLSDKSEAEEIMYPPLTDWKSAIKMAETLDDYTLRAITAKYIQPMPNTYTFSKRLAEDVVNDYSKNLPSVVIRPSIIVSIADEPFPGWIDNFNGPIGLFTAGGKGVLRVTFADPMVNNDYLPVDVAIKGIILAAWKRGLKTVTMDPTLHIYNCSSYQLRQISIGESMSMGFRCTRRIPLEGIIWYPRTYVTSSRMFYYILTLLLHLLPSFFLDGLLQLSGRKPILRRLYTKLFFAMQRLGHFTSNQWIFHNDKMLDLMYNNIPPMEQDIFGFDYVNFNMESYFQQNIVGVKQYLLKETKSLESAKRHYDRMEKIDTIFNIIISVVLTWIFWKVGFFGYLATQIQYITSGSFLYAWNIHKFANSFFGILTHFPLPLPVYCQAQIELNETSRWRPCDHQNYFDAFVPRLPLLSTPKKSSPCSPESFFFSNHSNVEARMKFNIMHNDSHESFKQSCLVFYPVLCELKASFQQNGQNLTENQDYQIQQCCLAVTGTSYCHYFQIPLTIYTLFYKMPVSFPEILSKLSFTHDDHDRNAAENASVAAFFADRSVFITGGTGFLGKVLIEKLLRSCPNVREIFVLIRPKKGLSIDQRLKKMIELPLFDKVRELHPSNFEKLIPILGDVSEKELGLQEIDRQTLIDRVSVIFHNAAHVRFEEDLKKDILSNTRSTRDICILAKSMKNLASFVYISTAFTLCDKPEAEEIMYPPLTNWRDAIKMAETLDEYTIRAITSMYIKPMPNTYTFSKRLAEDVVNDYSKDLPSVIIRPSIVLPTITEPVPGWVDNFNGPVALFIAGGKGVLRVIYAELSGMNDYLPVDIVIRSTVLVAWKRGVKTLTMDPSVHIYNCTSYHIHQISVKESISIGKKLNKDIPLEGLIWAPKNINAPNRLLYYILTLILHILPSFFFDGLLQVLGRKPMLRPLYIKVFFAQQRLDHFTINHWIFYNNKMLDVMYNGVPPAETDAFGFDFASFNITQYMTDIILGAKRFLLKETGSLESAKRHYRRMEWIHQIFKTIMLMLIIWIVWKIGFFGYISAQFQCNNWAIWRKIIDVTSSGIKVN
ncbi:uncharacterized protein LOC143186295 [Calliopsis andreniformis]|uniref:uncharacterized protein LOC143186295 n=1 Tax=Calliopsis andreniformis TaxID=337506 RepID=UPI003FCDC8E9